MDVQRDVRHNMCTSKALTWPADFKLVRSPAELTKCAAMNDIAIETSIFLVAFREGNSLIQPILSLMFLACDFWWQHVGGTECLPQLHAKSSNCPRVVNNDACFTQTFKSWWKKSLPVCRITSIASHTSRLVRLFLIRMTYQLTFASDLKMLLANQDSMIQVKTIYSIFDRDTNTYQVHLKGSTQPGFFSNWPAKNSRLFGLQKKALATSGCLAGWQGTEIVHCSSPTTCFLSQSQGCEECGKTTATWRNKKSLECLLRTNKKVSITDPLFRPCLAQFTAKNISLYTHNFQRP